MIPQVICLAELLPIFDTSVLDSVFGKPGVLPQHDILGETLPTLFIWISPMVSWLALLF